MSNNKQSIKLYTEEQVRKAIELSRNTHQEGKPYLERDEYDYSIDEVVDSLTPIELPSDEEIGKLRDEHIPIDEENMWSERFYFTIGAKAMRNKIQGGNK